MYVSWLSLENTGTLVQYGTTLSLGQQASGNYQDIGVVRWHSVNVTGLTADTKYYYRCISGSDTSDVSSFRTPPLPTATGKHIRFLKFGDSQDDAARSTMIADTAAWKMKQLFGNNWYDSINLVMHSGDMTQDGTEVARFMNEYFNSFASLSAHIPFMVAIGNHEGESNNYYYFMKYEGYTGFNERYYTYNLGNCQFIALNTNGLYNNLLQTNWLQTQLTASANDANIDFVFSHFHHPAHSEIWPDGNTSYVQDNLLPVFKNYPKMAMYTYGHSHNFERGTIRSTHAQNWDFRSVLSGGAGGPLDRWGMYTNQQDYPENQKSIDNYNFLLVDVDMDKQTVKTYTYSLGNTDRPRNVELIDKWHRYLNQAAPDKPLALSPATTASATPVLTAGPFAGLDTLMSSEFQLVATTGSFASPLISVSRDTEDYYGDSGSPLYNPSNLNATFDLKRYYVPVGELTVGQSYMWRMRYRDQNVRWSDWSDTLTFTVQSNPADAVDFIADVVSGNTPLTVHFTDLSVNNPFTWQWDLNGDGSSDDYSQDPVYTYTIPGLYTVSLTSQVGAQILTNTKPSYINVMVNGVAENEETHVSVYPNPTSGKVTIAYSGTYGKAEICITDINGKIIRTFADNSTKGGIQSLEWDGCNAVGQTVAPGIYLCRIQTDNVSRTVKMIRY
jgi:PKD repeat protein